MATEEWLATHRLYTKSPEWQARKASVLRRDGYVCQACGTNPATQVHHLTYRHWGHEPLFDLVAVCKPCHDRITEMDRSPQASRPDVEFEEWAL
jgi:5-methylcytosine-specific restriction endonuclease McrA